MPFIPLNPPRDPKDCPAWLFEALKRLNRAAMNSSQGLAAVVRGEAPDGSGDPLPSTFDPSILDDYLFKPGQVGGQTIEVVDAAPAVTIHNSALGKSQRWEGPSTTVTSCVSDGTAVVTHGSGGFALLAIGMSVSGSVVPAGTLVTEVTNSGQITLSNNISAGTTTMVFAHRMDLSFVANGTGQDVELLVSTGLRIRGSSQLGGQATGLRLTAQTALNSTIRAFIEAGPSNENMALTGDNGGTGNSFHDLFTYSHFGTWSGSALTNDSHVGINTDPYEYRSSAAGNQPDSLIVARRASATTGVPTIIIEGASSTEMAFALSGASSGTTPSKIRGASIAGFRHDGDLVLFNSGTASGLVNGLNAHGGSSQVLQINSAITGQSYLGIGAVGSWSDSLTDTDSRFALWGSLTSSTHRAFYFASAGFGIFTRFGLSSAYTLISNGQAGGASGAFPGPDGSGSPSVLRLLNTSTAGFDASALLTLETLRSGQTGPFLRCIDSSAALLSGIEAKGNFFAVGTAMTPTAPAAATAGQIKLFADSGLNVSRWAMKDETNPEVWIAPHRGWIGECILTPQTGATVADYAKQGWPLVIYTTTLTSTALPSNSSFSTAWRRMHFISSGSAANTNSGVRNAETMCWIGASAGVGGFYFCTRFFINHGSLTDTRAFIGLSATTGALFTSTNPSALLNCIALAIDSGDTNYQIMHNDGSGTCTKIDLGTNYGRTDTNVIQFELYCAPNGSSIYYRVQRLDDRTIAPTIGTLSTNLPANTAFFSTHQFVNIGPTGGATPFIDIYRSYLGTNV